MVRSVFNLVGRSQEWDSGQSFPPSPSLRVGDRSALLSVLRPVGVKVRRLRGLIFHLAWLSLAIPDSQVPAGFRDQEAGVITCCESQPWDPGWTAFASGDKGARLSLNRGAGHAALVSFPHGQPPVVSPWLGLSLCLIGTPCLSQTLLFLTLNGEAGKSLWPRESLGGELCGQPWP